MEGTYPILHGDQPVGKAVVIRQGLYYCVTCRMQPEKPGIYRAELCCGKMVENLGIPVPEGDGFVVTRRIPASRVAGGAPEFRIFHKNMTLQGRFVPISPEEPFGYLDRLKNAYLMRKGAKIGIIIGD